MSFRLTLLLFPSLPKLSIFLSLQRTALQSHQTLNPLLTKETPLLATVIYGLWSIWSRSASVSSSMFGFYTTPWDWIMDCSPWFLHKYPDLASM
ncbi:hypothetical protein FKM82_027500 [Ascaphus truei]